MEEAGPDPKSPDPHSSTLCSITGCSHYVSEEHILLWEIISFRAQILDSVSSDFALLTRFTNLKSENNVRSNIC